MPDKDAADGPSLELPSFGFGRKKRKERVDASHPEVPATPDPGPEVTPEATPEVPSAPDRGPEVIPGAAPEVPRAPQPSDAPAAPPEIDPLVPTAPAEPDPHPEIDPHVPASPREPEPAPEIDPLIPTEPEWRPPSEPRPEPTPRPEPEPHPEPEPSPEPEPGPDPEPAPEERDRATAVLLATPGTAGAVGHAETRPTGASSATGATHLDERAKDLPHADADPSEPHERRGPTFPTVPALPAVLVVGAVVGLVAVLLTWGSLQLCDAATGTASCGGGPGLLMLLAILIALTYLGGWLLRGFGLSDAGSTSFLAVGLLAVVAMLFLIDTLDEWSGAVWVVAVTIAAYAVSWRVTAALVDAGADQQ